MRNILFSVLLLILSNESFTQTLFTYGTNAVTKEEFLKAYNKNKTVVPDKEASLKEYLELYTKFKLKVKAAKDLGLDTLPQLKYDVESFRKQVEESYMSDEKMVDAMVNEAFERSQKDIHVYHFFVPIPAGTTAQDTVKAYTALNEVSKQLKEGKTDFAKITADVSASFNTIKSGDLGFVTAFTLPYEYENIVYSLKAGEASQIYRSRKGVHIFKHTGERKNAGKWKIAQILFAFSPGESISNSNALKSRADSVYKLLKNGGDFSSLAKKNSDDKMTYTGGGELPEFTTGKFQPQFENEVFKLKNDGDISEVFATSFGYHIVKRIEQTPLSSSKENTNYLFELKQKIQQDVRINIAREKFALEILTKLGYKKNTAVKDAELFKYADSVSANPQALVMKYPIYTKTIFSFKKTNYTGANWLAFVNEYKTNGELYQGENNTALLNKFIQTSALEHYKKNLEEYNIDFKYQMTEFKEGNMLFEIMERKVWSKAANDNAGLLKHYEENKSKYRWAASASVILFNCNSEPSASKAIAELSTGKNWKKIVEESNNTIQSDSGRYEISQIPVKEGSVLKENDITQPVVNGLDGSASFVKIIKLYSANEQRKFEEAKGLIINDFQTVVEERWINDLKKKYPIKINEVVFASLLK